MKKINVLIHNNTTLILQEDAQKGDIIDLTELQKVDLSFIEKAILEEKEASYQKQLEENYKIREENIKKDFQYRLLECNAKLENLKSNKKLEIETEVTKMKSLYQLEKEQLKNNLTQEIEKLKHHLETIKQEKENEFILEKSKLEMEHTSSINKQNDLIASYKNTINELKQKNELSLKEKELNHLQELSLLKEKKDELQNEIDKLRLSKSSLNIKMLGEELENWCNEEYESYASIGFTNCTWQKDNIAVKLEDESRATKADYIFRVFLNEEKNIELSSICCEMKNEAIDSKSKKKNSDHFAKLDADRKKKNCEYALLISELEWNSINDTPIKKVREYEKMYVVRPQYFITFLSLITSLATKYKDVITQKQKEELHLMSSKELIEEFEELKEKYIEKPLRDLEKKLDIILSSSAAITNANQKIQTTCEEIKNIELNKIQTKINTFNIKKLGKKLDKLTVISE